MTKTIAISDNNHGRLLRIGRMNDSMDDVIGRLLDLYESKKEVKK